MTQPNLHKLGCQGKGPSGGFHGQRLMGALMVVKADPVANDAAGLPV